MKRKETPGMDRLTAVDPALVITEDELARSREKTLAVMDTDAEQLAVGGSLEDSHQQRSRRRMRLAAGFGLVAAAAVVAGVIVTTSLPADVVPETAPVATQPGIAPETGSSQQPPLPEITGRMPTFDNHIVTGGNGNKAAVADDPEADFHMDAADMGKLGLNSSGCFVNASAEGSSNGLIFPAGTNVTETGVVFPDGKTLNIGDEFAFGGGLSPELEPSPCAVTGVAFLVQSWGPLP
ncbi:hypothetical protein ACIQH5_06335 [Paenarthrobacter sp. NPDC091711]|uniref:hypothetical protein n=1 Tax=Paenarthrobacter sp. NPDC091711 TaxID=3364385 RepID=UPI0037F4A4E8